MAKKKNTLTREQAAELYKDLQKAMGGLKAKPKTASTSTGTIPAADTARAGKMIAAEISKALRSEPPSELEQNSIPLRAPSFAPASRGTVGAVTFVLMVAAVKVGLAVLEATGLMTATPAAASVSLQAELMAARAAGPKFSTQEVAILTSLDARRSELEERGRQLDERKADLERQDRELAVKLSELKELTTKLASTRDKDTKKRSTQLEQLANVYGAMNPSEAATLLEQLDLQIALQLVQRMPEKRIGQILALMSKERAIMLTRLISEKIE